MKIHKYDKLGRIPEDAYIREVYLIIDEGNDYYFESIQIHVFFMGSLEQTIVLKEAKIKIHGVEGFGDGIILTLCESAVSQKLGNLSFDSKEVTCKNCLKARGK